MHWLLGRRSKLSLENKIRIYKTIIKPIWTYGIELWGCSKPSHTKVLQRFQSKTLRMILDVPWYVTNQTIHADLGIPFITEVINLHATRTKNRNSTHPHDLVRGLYHPPTHARRLNRKWPEDLGD